MIEGSSSCPRRINSSCLGLFSLEKREAKKNMTEVYKIMRGAEREGRKSIFSLSHNTRTWGQPLKLKGGRFRPEKGVLPHTVHKWWNLLPQDVEGSKRGVDTFMGKVAINSY